MNADPNKVKHAVVEDPDGDLLPDKPIEHLWIKEPRFTWSPFAKWLVKLQYADGTGWTWETSSYAEAHTQREKLKRTFGILAP